MISNFETYKKFQRDKKLNNSYLINKLFQFDKFNIRNNNINNSLLNQQSTKNKNKKIIFNIEKKENENN